MGAVLLALALHPLQFNLIQLFEGYWGQSRLGQWAALAGVLRHRKRAFRAHEEALAAGAEAHVPGAAEPAAAKWDAAPEEVAVLWKSMEAWRRYGAYPHRLHLIMPTRLGNILRRYEVLAGKQFGLDAIATVPRLLQVADPRDVEYVQNQRLQLELAVRSSALALLASVITVGTMWTHGWYLLLALVPYAIAYLAYRGSVTIAEEYGTALAVLIELNRFALYERLRLPLPGNLREERDLAERLTRMLRLDNVDIQARLVQAELTYQSGTDGQRPPVAERTQDSLDGETALPV